MERVLRDWNLDHHCFGPLEHFAPNYTAMYYCTMGKCHMQCPVPKVNATGGSRISLSRCFLQCVRVWFHCQGVTDLEAVIILQNI